MAIIDFNSQIRYTGPGPIDSKIAPVNSVADLQKISSASRYPGMTITVLNGDNGKVQDYWFIGTDRFNGSWVKKIDNFSLHADENGVLSLTYDGESIDKASVDLVPLIENTLQSWQFIDRGEIVSSGDTISLILYYNSENDLPPVIIDLSLLKAQFPSIAQFNELYEYAHSLSPSYSGTTNIISGKGIEINKEENKSKISVKLMTSSEEKVHSGGNKNFIEYVDDSIAVRGIDADTSVITSDIKVAGLANQLGSGEYANNSIIPAGTSVQEILEKLFCKEIWNNSKISVSSLFDVTLGDDSKISINTPLKVEVGQEIIISEFNANVTNEPKQSYTVGIFDYGYAWNNQGSGATTDIAYTENLSPSLTNSTNSLKESFSGFKTLSGNSIDAIYGIDKLPSITVYASEGNNLVSIEQSGWTYNSESVEPKTMYIATNLGNYYKEDKSTDNTFTPLVQFAESKTAYKRLEKGVDAFYAMYMGCIPIEKDYTNYFYNKDSLSGLNYSLIEDEEITIDEITSDTMAPSIAIVIPNMYKISSMKNSLGAPIDVSSNFVNYNEIRYINGPFETKYNVYILSSSSKITYKEIKINKK